MTTKQCSVLPAEGEKSFLSDSDDTFLERCRTSPLRGPVLSRLFLLQLQAENSGKSTGRQKGRDFRTASYRF